MRETLHTQAAGNTAPKPRRTPRRRVARLCVAAGSALIVTACVTANYVALSPPQIPGASFVGSESCADCHNVISARFAGATHARLASGGLDVPGSLGCEACHGPGSLHVENGGESRSIISAAGSPEICINCHSDVGGQIRLPSAHPVMSGALACTDCHNPHEGNPVARGGFATARLGVDRQCLECHQAQRGPYVFRHEAMDDGCQSCHHVHGSVNRKLLVARDANLCLRCHFQQQAAPGQLLIGNVNHAVLIRQGTCWSAGCHEAVHGSNVNSHLRY